MGSLFGLTVAVFAVVWIALAIRGISRQSKRGERFNWQGMKLGYVTDYLRHTSPAPPLFRMFRKVEQGRGRKSMRMPRKAYDRGTQQSPRLAAASLIKCVVCCSGSAVLGWVPPLGVSSFRDRSFA
jgi:hypothetical protein